MRAAAARLRCQKAQKPPPAPLTASRLAAARRCAVVSVYNARTEEKVFDLGAGEGAVHAVSISPLCVSPPHEAPRFLSVACRA